MAGSDLADRGSGPDRLKGSRGRSLPSGTWRHVSEAHVRFIAVATVPISSALRLTWLRDVSRLSRKFWSLATSGYSTQFQLAQLAADAILDHSGGEAGCWGLH